MSSVTSKFRSGRGTTRRYHAPLRRHGFGARLAFPAPTDLATIEFVELDTSHFPLIVLRWTGSVSDEELEDLIQRCNALADRAASEQRHYAVVSIGDAHFGPKQRKRVATWMNEHPEHRARWDLGNHVVVHGSVARGALTAVKWLAPRLSKVFMHPDERTAVAAARASLSHANAERTG